MLRRFVNLSSKVFALIGFLLLNETPSGSRSETHVVVVVGGGGGDGRGDDDVIVVDVIADDVARGTAAAASSAGFAGPLTAEGAPRSWVRFCVRILLLLCFFSFFAHL